MILIRGALLGFISVAFGAFTGHELREGITDDNFRFLMTAIRYNQIHTVVISMIGLALLHGQKLANIPALKWGGLFFSLEALYSASVFISQYGLIFRA